MRLYNTLTRRVETFEPLDPGRVTVYSCGPTVYRDVHLGNLRTYLMADWLKRTLLHLGYKVFHVKNITDVGHMRMELLDRGEDKVIAAARALGKTSREIAQHYTEIFLSDEARLNILPADVYPRATEHVPHCIALVEEMIRRGNAYEAGGNVYFDISTFPDYGRLSGNPPEALLKGVRVDVDPLKRRPEDFALWKAAEPGREMKWDSPWGEGFPGWHIECSAMSLHYLGEAFDIHTGGVDNIFPHHEDEIAQSESVVGHQVVRHWVHGQHLLADGLKMAKSTGNDYTIRDLEARGFDPLAFRYLCLTAHYRSRLNFTFNALRAAQRGLSHLRRHVEDPSWRDAPSPRHEAAAKWRGRFLDAICSDLSMPTALAVTWDLLQDRCLSPIERVRLLMEFDAVLGLGLDRWPEQAADIPTPVMEELQRRERLRREGRLAEADSARDRLEAEGFEVRDLPKGPMILRRSKAEWKGNLKEISSSREVPSLLHEPDRYDVTVSLVAHNNLPDLRRCYSSVKAHCGGHRVQIILVEGGSRDETRSGVGQMIAGDPDAVVWYADHSLGEGAFRNVALRQALGTVILILDTSVEFAGDALTPLTATLSGRDVGLTGLKGLVTSNCQEFEEAEGPEVHAVALYCLAFPRRILRDVGWMDERFRFYRHLDLDFSFRIRSHGYRAVVTPGLPVILHPHRLWEEMDEYERFRRSRANFYIFYRRWHHHRYLFSSGEGQG
jgi:cysteinyl-tRNA synthetase